ncbi:MAG: response regulator transcription factor [Pseudomonadota bacterium]
MTQKERYTAIIADDHGIVRDGFRSALEKPGMVEAAGLHVLSEAANGVEAIEQVKFNRPNLLLLDISMPMASGAEILTDIKRWSPDTKIVVITAVTSPGLLASMVEQGVDGLFSKASDNTELYEKLPIILRGGRHVAEPLAALIEVNEPAPDLSARERQTLNMVVAGKTNAEIADLMGISPRTAEKHRASLMAKMDVKSLVELMSKALHEGLIEQHGHLD